MKIANVIFSMAVFFVMSTSRTSAQNKGPSAPGLTQLQAMSSRFAPTPMRVDTSKLSAGDRQALVKLIEAGRVIDDIFLQQYWSGNPALYSRLQKDATALGRLRQHYFWINRGPWSVLDGYKAFLPGVPGGKTQRGQFLSRRYDTAAI